MKLSDDQLIAIGLQVQEARKKGGERIKAKFGLDYFRNLNKLSQAAKRKKKKLSIDS